MKEVSLFLANGFEEIEGLTVVDFLRRAGIEIETVSIMDSKTIHGAHGIIVEADKMFDEADFSEDKMLVLPGGLPGTDYLRAHEGLRELILKFNQEKRQLAAICAAPTVFGGLGILKDRRATCYPGLESGLDCMEALSDGVVTDGHITTGRGMGVSIDFASRLTEILRDEKTAMDLRRAIVVPED